MGTVKDIEERWFKHECVLLQGAGSSPYGGIAGDELPVKGFVRQSINRVTTVNGEATVTDTIVYVPLSVVVARGDQIRLPEPFDQGPWEVTETAVFEGAGNETPNHQKLMLTIPGDAANGDPYENEPEDPYSGGAGPYG